MYLALLILHILICLGLVGVVLIQSGKGGGLSGGAFGGSAQTVFGGRGATDFITRATMILGAAFFITSLTLALMSSGVGTRSRSLIQTEAARRAGSAPATQPPGTPPTGTVPAPAGTPGPGQPPPGSQTPAAPGTQTPPAPGSQTPPNPGGK